MVKLQRFCEAAKRRNTDNFRSIQGEVAIICEIFRTFAGDMYNKKIPIDISCGFRIAIEVMDGKWKPYIIYELLDGPKRPSALGLPLGFIPIIEQLRDWGRSAEGRLQGKNDFRPKMEENLRERGASSSSQNC